MSRKLILLPIVIIAAAGVVVWAVVHSREAKRNRLRESVNNLSNVTKSTSAEAWAEAIEKIKADRGEAGGKGAIEIPPELKHYSDRHWFLSTQVAEIEKYNVQTCQDFLDLAALIARGEMVAVPAVTETYVLFGVGAKVDEDVFTGYQGDHTDQSYGQTDSRQKLFHDYESLQALAKNFAGRSYDLASPSDRQAMKINMLRSLRPEALKILEEVASAYHQQFDRPLPVSSLVRPEQYQHALNRVNRNAVLIDTPPHSTGLAFDIDYRYMSAAEQTFLMAHLARLKDEGRIEVIRERKANYHVFAFVNGTRPSDELITASLDKASAPVQEAHHAPNKPANVKSKSQKHRTAKARPPRSNMRENRKRRR
jgi:hypothetical protein